MLQTFVREFDLPVDQVKLNPSMDVSDGTSLNFPPEHGVSEASTTSTMNLCSPIIRVTFFMILAESSRVAQRNSRQ